MVKKWRLIRENFQTKEQEEIERLMNIIICENKEALKELAK